MSKANKKPVKPPLLESGSSQESSVATTAALAPPSRVASCSTVTVRADCHTEETTLDRRKSLQRQSRVQTESDCSRPVSVEPPKSGLGRRRRRLSRAERNRRTLERLSSVGKISSTSLETLAKSASTFVQGGSTSPHSSHSK